jgi:FkbM family methyltransferase
VRTQLRKAIRTIQSEAFFLKEAKDAYYRYSRRLLRRPHEKDFYSIRFIPDQLAGSYLDVGANHGQSIESIKLFKPGAKIHSFEANPRLAGILEKRYRNRDDVFIHGFGLADEAHNLPLFTPVYKKFVYDGLASFDRESAVSWLGPETLYLFTQDRLTLIESVCQTKRLDDQDLDPVFMKVDVQGYEYQVLKGGLNTIERSQPVMMLEEPHQAPALMKLLQSLGYDEYLFDANGFYPGAGDPGGNAFFMTPRRADQVVRSSGPPGSASS